MGEFLPSNAFTDWIAGFFCDEGIFQGICENVVFILCGFDEPQTNHTLFETIVHHTPAGASTNTLLHYAQEINSSKYISLFPIRFKTELLFKSRKHKSSLIEVLFVMLFRTT